MRSANVGLEHRGLRFWWKAVPGIVQGHPHEADSFRIKMGSRFRHGSPLVPLLLAKRVAYKDDRHLTGR
jgi:hypothetical protein